MRKPPPLPPPKTERPLFPEDRAILAVFCPIMALSFAVALFITFNWKPFAMDEKIGRVLILAVLFFLTLLSIIGFAFSICGLEGFRRVFARLAIIALSLMFSATCAFFAHLLHRLKTASAGAEIGKNLLLVAVISFLSLSVYCLVIGLIGTERYQRLMNHLGRRCPSKAALVAICVGIGILMCLLMNFLWQR